MRRLYLYGNWKMNHGASATRAFFEELSRFWPTLLAPATRQLLTSGELVAGLFPPALSLAAAIEGARGFSIELGAQQANEADSGAFTGELAAQMFEEIGIKTALVGHSERRTLYGETDASAARRAAGLLKRGFRVVYCVGERGSERETGQTHAVLERQMRSLIAALPPSWDNSPLPQNSGRVGARLLLAYEPVWAIGTGVVAEPAQIADAHDYLATLVPAAWRAGGFTTPVLYGGSVTPKNLPSLLALPGVDGALVGGASLSADSFLELLERAGRTRVDGA